MAAAWAAVTKAVVVVEEEEEEIRPSVTPPHAPWPTAGQEGAVRWQAAEAALAVAFAALAVAATFVLSAAVRAVVLMSRPVPSLLPPLLLPVPLGGPVSTAAREGSARAVSATEVTAVPIVWVRRAGTAR